MTDAVDEGLIPRSPAARVGLPRTVAKEVKPKDAVAWDAADVDRFLGATAEHRWAVAFPLDDDTVRALTRRRAEQAAERLAAGSEWRTTT